MVDENSGPPEAGRPVELPEIPKKPLPQVLDAMEVNIRAATEAVRVAQEAVTEAARATTKASGETS
ncbi:hypothetical protein ACFLU8_01100 [Chloroflexota bacterium]